MMMDNIPKIAETHVKEQFKKLNQAIVAGEVQMWLDKELTGLHEKNPVLYHFITERANKFAVGATMVNDPQAVAISMALEYIILLKILNTSIGAMLGLEKFSDMMKGWFPGSDDLKGIDGIGK